MPQLRRDVALWLPSGNGDEPAGTALEIRERPILV